MATKKKMLQAAAGSAAGGAALDVESVFSTYLYEGTGATQTITNGIDLDGEGGLVWIKDRDVGNGHNFFDTERGATKRLVSNLSNGETTVTNSVTSFNANGFSGGNYASINTNGNDYASWTFRKAPKFFDVVTWTGDGTNNRTLSHNLGCEVGFIAIKRYNGTGNWRNYHRSLGYDYEGYFNYNDQFYSGSTAFGSQNATSTNFYVGSSNNDNGHQYVAYLFAHNNNDGGFGPDGDLDAIKCGSYTGNGSSDGPEIDLGFEPQWLLTKRSSGSDGWGIYDSMRGISTGGTDPYLSPHDSNSESGNGYYDQLDLLSTGFKLKTTSGTLNQSGETYIYIAIRRGTKVPESATEVFDVTEVAGAGAGTSVTTGFPVDFTIVKAIDSNTSWEVWDRLRGARKYLLTDSTAADGTAFTSADQWLHDDMTGFSWNAGDGWSNSGGDFINYSWKRAPGYFDAVAWSGDGTGSARIIPHNLTVEPEIIISKQRNGISAWSVYVKNLWTSGSYLSMELNTSAAASSNGSIPNSSVYRYPFRTGDPNEGDNITNFCAQGLNNSGEDYIAYLFASLDGISKVGSFTISSGQSSVVDCGFSSGARFVLMKRYDGSDYWWVFDTERGITVSSSPGLRLDTTGQESSDTYLTPNSSGFATVAGYFPAGDYIFYAIA
jgi:hypothetical protein